MELWKSKLSSLLFNTFPKLKTSIKNHVDRNKHAYFE